MSLAIDECIQSNISEVRYAALETLQKSPCSMYDYSSLLMIWQKPSLDDYSQIHIYKALARCPTETLPSTVMHKLLLQNVTQVTSYIWSHLTNFKDQTWTGEILSDARLSNKFTKEKLKFSRNFRKDIILSNKTFTVEFDVIFSGEGIKPQYSALRVTTDDFKPHNIFEMEMREKNEVPSSSYGYNTYYDYDYSSDSSESIAKYRACKVTMFDFVIHEKNYDMNKKYSIWSFDEIYGYAFMFGYRIIAKVSIEYLYQFFSRMSSENYQKVFDVQLQYPTSMGVPIKMKMNMTTGSHEGTLLLSYAKKIDAELSLDATHAEIGCKLEGGVEFLPKIKASADDGKLQLHFSLPEEKTSLFNIDYGTYTFENDYKYPKYFSNETEFTSLCIPAIQEFTGFTFCLDYFPRIRYWPIYTFRYGLSYQRDAGVQGIEVTYNSKDRDNLLEVSVETPGSPSSTWSVSKYELAQFVNINITTPFFKLNGSGVSREDALYLKESGQGLNISGTFQYRGDVAPFILISKFILNFQNDISIQLWIIIYTFLELAFIFIYLMHNKKNSIHW